MKVILLTGIHGVGKNHICERINKKLNIPIYSASELIKKYNSRTDINKRALNINKNQKILLDSLKKDIKDHLFVLNGHTCLINIKDKIVKLDNNWFKRMKVIGIIILYDNVKSISKRLYERDKIKFDLKLLEKFQENEIENSLSIANALNIPVIKMKNNGHIMPIIEFIKSL